MEPTPLEASILAFQAYLEGVRAHPDDDELREDLERARIAMDVAYWEATVGRGTGE